MSKRTQIGPKQFRGNGGAWGFDVWTDNLKEHNRTGAPLRKRYLAHGRGYATEEAARKVGDRWIDTYLQGFSDSDYPTLTQQYGKKGLKKL